jgi:hypothetical protein
VRPAICARVTVYSNKTLHSTVDTDGLRHAGESLPAQVPEESMNSRRPSRSWSSDHTVFDRDRTKSIDVIAGPGHESKP